MEHGARGRSGIGSGVAAIALASALLGAGGHGFGAVWHVRSDGSDGACSGLTDAADPGSGITPRYCSFQTPQKGTDSAGPGDTVTLHAGTYTTGGTSIFGIKNIIGLSLRTDLDSETNRLTITSAVDGEAVFDGPESWTRA